MRTEANAHFITQQRRPFFSSVGILPRCSLIHFERAIDRPIASVQCSRYEASEQRSCRGVKQWRGTQRYLPLRRTDEDQLTQAILAVGVKYGLINATQFSLDCSAPSDFELSP